jgi:DNA-binding response OmpR family regulator
MKQILVIDESPLFREYLRLKLTEHAVEVEVALNSLDGISKIRTINPDLIIMDYHLSKQGCLEILQKKRESPATAGIPVILTAQHIDQQRIIELAPYKVKKVFSKPVKIEALFETLSEMLGVPFEIDETPGIVDVHVNDDIIFIEVAQGINRDKLDLLRFKLIELIGLYNIKFPKVIIMLSDIELDFSDGPNLQKLLETVLQTSRVQNLNIRILTRDAFARDFIQGQKEYAGIEVVDNLQNAMGQFLSELNPSRQSGEEEKAAIIGDRLLKADERAQGDTMQLRFNAASSRASLEEIRTSAQNLKIAVVDDDFVIQELIKNTFQKAGAAVTVYGDGETYLASAGKETFDLVFLDLMMPRVDGFMVLRTLQDRNITQPVIVLSAVTQRQMIIKAFQLGIKSYLVKPLKPADVFKKTMEILKTNF